eukprot:220556_1
MSKRGKKKKKKHVSIRDQMRNAKKGGPAAADNEEAKTSDPVGALNADWFKIGKKADAWKDKWECMQSLMTFATGDSFGNAPMPKKFDDNKVAADVLALLTKWINDANGHIFTRQHILRLLKVFGKSYGKSSWKKSNVMARGIMEKQWLEKKPGFWQYVTPALIGVYEGSQSSLKSWKNDLLEASKSEQSQIRMSCWDFLAKVCMIGDISDYNISSGKSSKDITDIIDDSSMMFQLSHALLEDGDKSTRDAAAKFVYGARNVCGGTGKLKYNDIRNDKRASTALDGAGDLYNRDIRILKGLKAPTDEDLKKKQEKKAERGKAKQKNKRKNNMRAAIMAARRKAAKEGGGGQIEVSVMGGGAKSDDDSDDGRKKHKKK